MRTSTTSFLALFLALSAPPCSEAGESPLKDCRAVLATADEDVLAFYPANAKTLGLEGTATIACRQSVRARYENCTIVSETPSGQGFGKAALDIMDAANKDVDLNSSHKRSASAQSISLRFIPEPLSVRPNPFRWSITGTTDWAAFPTVPETELAYRTTKLARLGVDGTAVLFCKLAKDGRLETCSVESENPTDAGVGAAALSLTGRFRMKSTTEFGCSVQGTEVRVPVFFQRH